MRAGNIVTTSGDVSTPPGGAPCSCGDSSVIDLELAPADVAAIRFHPDPVWETVASLGVLAHPAKHPLHRDLLDRVREPDWDHDLLVAMMASDRWYPTTLAPVPAAHARPTRSARWRPSRTPTRTSPAPTWRCCGVPSPTSRAGAAYTVPRLLEDTATRSRRLLRRGCWRRCGSGSTTSPTSDIAYRSSSLASDGVGVTLGGLHERLTYAEGRLRLQMPGHHEHRQMGGAGVRLVPVGLPLAVPGGRARLGAAGGQLRRTGSGAAVGVGPSGGGHGPRPGARPVAGRDPRPPRRAQHDHAARPAAAAEQRDRQRAPHRDAARRAAAVVAPRSRGALRAHLPRPRADHAAARERAVRARATGEATRPDERLGSSGRVAGAKDHSVT